MDNRRNVFGKLEIGTNSKESSSIVGIRSSSGSCVSSQESPANEASFKFFVWWSEANNFLETGRPGKLVIASDGKLIDTGLGTPVLNHSS
jgi:hypothetical protein